jgi:hypothetical protein
MSPRAITIDHDATKPARNGGFVGIEVGADRSCSVAIGSCLAAIFDLNQTAPGIGAVYNRFDYLSEKRDMLTRLGARPADTVS